MVVLFVLLGFMILGAIIAIEVKGLLSSVVAVGVVGLGISIAFLLLKAPDVAITQLVVEIIAVIILIRATIHRPLPGSPTAGRPLGAILALAFVAALLAAAVPMLQDLPSFGEPGMVVARKYVDGGYELTGAANIVASVILDYRAYDTLGEATVLFTAVVGVLAVARTTGRRREYEAASPGEAAPRERGDE